MFSLTPARTTARNDEVREDIILLKTFFLYTSLSHPPSFRTEEECPMTLQSKIATASTNPEIFLVVGNAGLPLRRSRDRDSKGGASHFVRHLHYSSFLNPHS